MLHWWPNSWNIRRLVDFRITKSELGAFFRDEKHENYMDSEGDLRNFSKWISYSNLQELKKP
jgi:uncharacterized protein YehS (DUF1456 family)